MAGKRRANGNGAPRARVYTQGRGLDRGGAPFKVTAGALVDEIGGRIFEMVTIQVAGAAFTIEIDAGTFSGARQLAADFTTEIERSIAAAESRRADRIAAAAGAAGGGA